MSGECTHDPDAECIYPSDIDVLRTADDGDDVVPSRSPARGAGRPWRSRPGASRSSRGEFELPLDDSLYD